MGVALRSETLTILTLTGQTASHSTGQGGGFDLSSYSAFQISANTTNFGAGWTPAFLFSEDQGTTWTALPTSLMAAPGAIGANGVVLYPWLPSGPSVFPGRIRIGYTIASTAVTATMRVIGRY